MSKKLIAALLLLALGFAGYVYWQKPFNPHRYFAAVSIRTHGPKIEGLYDKKERLVAACVDKKNHYFLVSSFIFDTHVYDKIQLYFDDGTRSLARVVFHEHDVGFAILKAERIPNHVEALPVGGHKGAQEVEGYFLQGTPQSAYFECLPVALPSRQFHDVGHATVERQGLTSGILMQKGTPLIVGIILTALQKSTYFIKGDYIAYILSLLQQSETLVLHKPKYRVQGTATTDLEAFGLYNREIDRKLSMSENEDYAREVYVVVEGDGVMREGDIMKYRHMSCHKGVSRWDGLNKRTDTSNQLPVLRSGAVFKLASHTHPVSVQVLLYDDEAVFCKPGAYIAAYYGLRRDVWSYISRGVHRLTSQCSHMLFNRVNGQSVETVGALDKILRQQKSAFFTAENIYSPHIMPVAFGTLSKAIHVKPIPVEIDAV